MTVDDSIDRLSTTTHPYKLAIIWDNVFKIIIIHVMAIYGLYRSSLRIGGQGDLVYVLLYQSLVSIGILAGAHRLWSHRTYKARWPLKVILLILQTASMQNNVYDWCRDHRMHHKYSDTDADPHNATRGLFFSHMGWLMCRKHPVLIEKGRTLDMSDLWSDPLIRFQRTFYAPLVVLIRGLLSTWLLMYLFNYNLWDALCLNTLVYVVTLHHTFLVNSAGHLYGYKPYEVNINPRENKLVVYLSLGEGYHNYHHAFPFDYSTSEHSWNSSFNMTTAFIDLCAAIGLAYDRKSAPVTVVDARVNRTGDKMALVNSSPYKVVLMLEYVWGCSFFLWPWLIIFILRFINRL